ncbi:MAG: sugar phosphate isomerase/epimerase [Clostridia bacterium]|nr:sugar phosphate isomerase/epimerase [Clostridia bacterium]
MSAIPLYCSTGTIIGRVNGYNYRHILQIMPALCEAIPLDGLELMMLPAFLDRLPEMARELSDAGLRFPIIHADKEIGTHLSTGAATQDSALCADALSIWDKNCTMGERISAKQIVIHLWGGLDSDAHLEGNLRYLDRLRARAADSGLEVLIENVPCTTADPMANLAVIHAAFPDQRFVFDTRFAAFHGQLAALTETPWLIGDRLAHIHISDLREGEVRDFSRLRPILHPGEGKIDFPALTADLLARGYAGSVTLESPVMHEGGFAVEKLAASLSLLRRLLG